MFKVFVRALFAFLGLMVLAVVAAFVVVRWQVDRNHKERMAELAADYDSYTGAFLQDQETFAGLGLFEPRSGSDAGALLNSGLSWDGSEFEQPWRTQAGLGVATLTLDEGVLDALDAAGDAWPALPPASYSELDFGWMSRLAAYGYWSIFEGSPLELSDPAMWWQDPFPSFITLIHWSKLRLAKGIAEAEPMAAALEVRELARLCMSTETLIGAMIAASMLELEAHAHAALGPGAPAQWLLLVDEQEVEQMRRMIFAGPAYLGLETPEAYSDTYRSIGVGRCTAIHESFMIALGFRAFLESSMPEQFDRLDRILADGAGECRLVRLRKVWNDPESADRMRDAILDGPSGLMGGGGGSPGERIMSRAARLPGTERFVGMLLMEISSPGWFGRYANPR